MILYNVDDDDNNNNNNYNYVHLLDAFPVIAQCVLQKTICLDYNLQKTTLDPIQT